jgi:hypothetical protein
MKDTTDLAMQHLAAQREYVKEQQIQAQKDVAGAARGRSGIVDERMLAETMRSVRYADEARAASDLIDNSIESGAENVHVAYKTTGTKIEQIAIIDDGSGIDKTFLPHATKWGGSSNQGKRNLFGRFGFGLPSASVNRSRAYDVFSRTEAGMPFSAVTVDLDNLVDEDGLVPLPTAEERGLPSWVVEYLLKEDADGSPVFPGGVDAVRTVVIWRSFDRLKWGNIQQSSSEFRQQFGITYAGWLRVVTIKVNGAPVEPVDVLFTTPGYRWYEIEGFPNAENKSNITFDVKDKNGAPHQVTVRFSYLSVPANNATVAPEGKGNHTKIRQRIRKEYNGFFVTRHGRFIELVKSPIINWSTYARQVGVAIDFPPELDEFFGVTPDKQTVQLSAEFENMLETHGVVRAFKALAGDVQKERAKDDVEKDRELLAKQAPDNTSPRPSEVTLARLVELDVKKKRKLSDETKEEAERNLRRKIKEIAGDTGVPEDVVREAQEKVQRARPYRVDFVAKADTDPYYRPYMEGIQLVLEINTEHAWYTELYTKLNADQAELRSLLEVHLWASAIGEIDAVGVNKVTLRNERLRMSDFLANAIEVHPEVFNPGMSRAELSDLDQAPWAEDEDVDDPEIRTGTE